jgi:branched-chain amino acid transport system substrate-binding protein
MRIGWLLAGAALLATAPVMAPWAWRGARADEAPIRIGVIAEASTISGAAIPKAAQLAADEINAAGGVNGRKIELVTYDDHASSADAVRAFQRAATQDHVSVVIASFISEVVLALEPWSARLKLPMITPGAASNEISQAVKKDYAKFKYVFHGYLTSAFLARSVCDGAKDLLVDSAYHMKSTVIMSEDAAWTTPLDAGYQECLPTAGLKVLDHIRFSPDTNDFTPIFNRIEGEKPDVIVAGISHVGVQPTVQWTSQQVPVPMFGISSQATSSTFWQDTNGATQGVVFQTVAVPGVQITPKTQPFLDAYQKQFGGIPSYCGYTAYDEVYFIADAIKRAGATDADKLVTALEATNWEGTIGRTAFYGRDEQFPHALKYGPGFVTGIIAQWQGGKQVAIWPKEIAAGKLAFPSFVKTAEAGQ